MDSFKKSSSFLSITNDAICAAASKAMQLMGQAQWSEKPKRPLKCDVIGSDGKDFIPEISLDEVYCHDNIDDCWIVVYDRVFDVTTFLQEHPGGEEVLMEYAGRDATLAFRGVGHSYEALRALEEYQIGILPKKERLYSNGGKKVLEMISTGLGIV